MIPVLSGLFALGQTWLENKREKSKAKATQEVKLIEQAGSWEEIHAKNSGHSWKDEFLTIVLSAPFVILFYGALRNDQDIIDGVDRAFSVLDSVVPTEYWYLFGLAVGASFGVRKVSDAIIKIKSNR
jgi:hypothetical protein